MVRIWFRGRLCKQIALSTDDMDWIEPSRAFSLRWIIPGLALTPQSDLDFWKFGRRDLAAECYISRSRGPRVHRHPLGGHLRIRPTTKHHLLALLHPTRTYLRCHNKIMFRSSVYRSLTFHGRLPLPMDQRVDSNGGGKEERRRQKGANRSE